MLARLHHYEELEAFRQFFKEWSGVGWEVALIREGLCHHGQIARILETNDRGHLLRTESFPRHLLPRLRKFREQLLSTSLANRRADTSARVSAPVG